MFLENRNHSRFSFFVMPVAILLLATMCAYAAVAPPSQDAATPADAGMVQKGKEIFDQTCTGCHGASHTTIQRKSADRWRKTIYTMISRGAPVLPGEVEILTAFLTATYGPASPLPAFGEASTRPQQALPAGSEVVVRSCGGCHAVNLIFGSRKSPDGWRATIVRMRTNGATVSESEERGLVGYLAEHFGPQ
jgi:mono/diheme cytochrome c family protein